MNKIPLQFKITDMKKLFILAALMIAAFTTQAQTVDTTANAPRAVRIVGFKAKFVDTANAVLLAVKIQSDDLKDACQIYWQLLTAKRDVVYEGFEWLTGTDYAAWQNDKLYPYKFIKNKYNLTFR